METAATPTTFIGDILAGTIVEPGRPHHTKLLSAPGVRVVVLTFEAGQVLKEHQSPKALLMQALAGRVRITVDGETHELTPGALLRLDAGLPHMVEALAESRVILTMIG
jgi:quercetin dioxygenase-like cupin family protein